MNNFNSNNILNKIEIVKNKNSNNNKTKEALLKTFIFLIKNLEKIEGEIEENIEKTTNKLEDFLIYIYSKIEEVIERYENKSSGSKYYELKKLQQLTYTSRLENKKDLNIFVKYLTSKIEYLYFLEKKLKSNSTKFVFLKTKKLLKKVKTEAKNLDNIKILNKTLIENLIENFKYIKCGKNFPLFYVDFPKIKNFNFTYYEKQFDYLTDLWNEIMKLIISNYYSKEKLSLKIMQICLEKYYEIYRYLTQTSNNNK